MSDELRQRWRRRSFKSQDRHLSDCSTRARMCLTVTTVQGASHAARQNRLRIRASTRSFTRSGEETDETSLNAYR
jgi:hypothetical protein